MRVVIAEDLALLRDGLIRLLEASGFEVVACVDNGPDLKAALLAHRPDVAVVDVRMPPNHTDDGLRAAIEARRSCRGCRCWCSRSSWSRSTRVSSSPNGQGAGRLPAQGPRSRCRAVHRGRPAGGCRWDRDGSRGDRRVADPGRSRERPVESLSPREREVLGLMAEGRSNAAIAWCTFVSEKAVAEHISSIFIKLGLHLSDSDNRRVLAVLAYLGD